MKVHFECQYCGKSWTEVVYRQPQKTKCAKCGDSKIRMKEAVSIDTYKGCPPFPDADNDFDEYNTDVEGSNYD